MSASYAETFFFDLVVVFFVAIVMPVSVLLLRSSSTPGKLGGATLLGLSVLYVGGFEHYRLHAPEVRRLALLQFPHVSQPQTLPSRAHRQLASERVRAMLLASDPTRRRLLADGAAAMASLSAMPRRAILAAAGGA